MSANQFFNEVQIGRGFWPLAQHGYVIIEQGVLSLLGTKRQPINQAPLRDITARPVRLTRGQVLSVRMNGTKYNVSPGWGVHQGKVVLPGEAKPTKIAVTQLLELIETA